MTKHTPGSWKYSFESVAPEWAIVTTEGGSVIANVNADHRQEANARLIAAAPDMAREIATQVDWLKHVRRECGDKLGAIGIGLDQSIKYLEAVLAKATGDA